MADPNESTHADPPELREYFRVLWLRKWTLIIVTLLTVGVMVFLSIRQTPLYESDAKVLVPPPAQAVNADGGIEFGKSEPEVEAEVATSEPVAEAVIAALGLDMTPQALLDRVQVVPLKNTTSILIFNGRSQNPQQARSIAHEFALRYIQYRRDQYAAGFRTESTSINQQLQSVTQRLRNASPEERIGLLDQRSGLIARRDQLANAIAQTKATGGDILTDAATPGEPFQPNHVRNGLVGLIVGLLIGIGAALLKDYVDDHLRGAEDVERQVNAPVLAAIPRFGGTERRRKDRGAQAGPSQLVVAGDPTRSAPVEAYRTLRTNLMFMAASGPLRRLLVTSPRQGEGKSTTAANLALVFAQAGHRVLLIDADLRRPSVHRMLGLPNETGLSSVLSSQSSLEDAVQNPGVPGMRVVTSGPIPPNPVELLSSPSMRKLVDQVADVTDWLIMDAPPVLGLADASALSSMADGVLLVVSQDTSRRELAHARDQLSKVGVQLVGTVLNGFSGDVGSYYTRYYGEPDVPPETGRRGRKARREAAAEAGAGAAPAPEPEPPEAAGDPAEPANAPGPFGAEMTGSEPDAEPVTSTKPPDEFFLSK